MDSSQIQGKYMMQCWSAQAGYAPIAVEKTEGCWIHTKDGRKIFDLRSAHECINLGFNHPKVIEAMRMQLEGVIYVTDDFSTEPTAKLAQKLAEITPGSSTIRSRSNSSHISRSLFIYALGAGIIPLDPTTDSTKTAATNPAPPSISI